MKTFIAEINPTVGHVYRSDLTHREVQVLSFDDSQVEVLFCDNKVSTAITCEMFFRLFGSDVGTPKKMDVTAEMGILKARTVTGDNICFTNEYFRYVNHTDRLATTGFGTMEALKRNAETIRFDTGTVELMRARYEELVEEVPKQGP